MSAKFPTVEERMRANRLNRALGVKQDLLCLQVQGYLIDGIAKLDASAWRERFRQALHYRLTRELAKAEHRALPYRAKQRPVIWNRGTNADRAADILRHGPESKWWNARASKHSAGDDKRGIVWYLQAWARRGHKVTL